MWSFPVAPPDVRGLLVCVSVVLVIKLLLGKNTLNSPSSFHKERPSKGVVKADLDVILNFTESNLHGVMDSTIFRMDFVMVCLQSPCAATC